MRRIFVAAAVLLLGVALFGRGSTTVFANTYQVTILGDSGAGSLRDAITQANANPGQDAITISATGTITLASPLPDITDNVTITGPGTASLTISQCGACGGFRVVGPATAFTTSGLTITGGSNGLFTNIVGTVSLDRVSLTNMVGSAIVVFSNGNMTTFSNGTISGSNGGAISVGNNGNLTVSNSTVSNNTSTFNGGGAIINAGTFTLSNSTMSGNSATGTFSSTSGLGGAISGGSGSQHTINIFESTISGNTAARGGGGISEASTTGTVNLRNATISGNTTTVGGGGGIAMTAGTLNSTNATIVNNTVAGTLAAITTNAVAGFGAGLQAVAPATASLRNTIVANNNLDNCSGSITSLGNNLSSDASCAGFTGAGDQMSTNPLLGALANNGGPTQTHLPQTGSPAIDRGSNTGCPVTDQRGVTRPQDGDNNGTATCDVGAVEIAGTTTGGTTSPTNPTNPSAPAPSVPVIAVPQIGLPTPAIPVFQNPANGALFNPIAKTPTPRPAAVAPAGPIDPNAGIPALRPPNTGDGGLKAADLEE